MRIFVCLAFLALSYPAQAQTLGEAFWLLRIQQFESGPGLDASPIDAYRNAKSNVDVLGIRSVTGVSQLWLLEPHGSFASIEALDKALANVAPDHRREDSGVQEWLLLRPLTLLGIYRPGLSYRADEALKLFPLARYFRVSVFRIRPGTDIEFAELMRIRRLGLDSINLDRPEIGYQVISGSTSGTYIFLSPLTSLALMDNGLARMPAYAEEALQGAGKAGRQTAYEALLSREQLIFRVEPRASFVSPEFAGNDSAFWHPGQ
ncbi:MAG: hypothetical protein ABI693_04815 [Bryobacteraceae bacterium]